MAGMESWVWKFLVAAALGAVALGCVWTPGVWAGRVGRWVLLVLGAFVLWWWSGSYGAVGLGLGLWFGIPAVQACWLSRQLRFSLQRRLVAGVIDYEEFPGVHRVSRDIRGEGFAEVGDYWLKPSPIEQGYRLFAHREEPVLAARAVVRQGSVVLDYDVLLTVDEGGGAWLTWNYPLAYGLELPEEFQVLRCLEAERWEDLLELHREFLRLNGVTGRPLTGGPQDRRVLERCLRRMLEHNLAAGILSEGEDGQAAYTWRGSLLVGWQVMKEMLG